MHRPALEVTSSGDSWCTERGLAVAYRPALSQTSARSILSNLKGTRHVDDTCKIPDADLEEAARLESDASRTEDAEKAASLRFYAEKLRTPPNFPLLDHPRIELDEEACRVVLEEFGVVTPYTPEDDYWKTMPVRLVHDDWDGFQVEFGPYTLRRRELRVFSVAVSAWIKAEMKSFRARTVRHSPECASEDLSERGSVAEVVDLGAKRSEREAWMQLKQRLEKHSSHEDQ